MTKHLITLIGATAIGKTSMSIVLAKYFNAPIVSCDSRQFYKEMRIGTAVPTEDELSAAEHHFIQDRSVMEPLNVGSYEKLALKRIETLFTNHDQVLLVGGSGLYMKAVLEGLDYFPEIDHHIRERLNAIVEKEGLTTLQRELKELDPLSYDTIDLDNPHRVIRALEVCLVSGKPFSAFKDKPKEKRKFTPIKIGLDAPRELIYERINSRVDAMIEEGLVEEAKALFEHKERTALQTVGYQELFHYFEGATSLADAVEEIKKNTRRFAKRQHTWNKKEKEVAWFDFPFDQDAIIRYIESRIESRR
jgi:tRNA dimethylallyltransferase